MADSDRPHSPFAGKLDFSAWTPVRALPLDEIEQMLAAHRLYLAPASVGAFLFDPYFDRHR
jgi:hypothetical protein